MINSVLFLPPYFMFFTIFQLTVLVRWFWSVRMGSSGRPSTSPLGVTSWPSSPVWKPAFYRGVSWSRPSGPRKARCVTALRPRASFTPKLTVYIYMNAWPVMCRKLGALMPIMIYIGLNNPNQHSN